MIYNNIKVGRLAAFGEQAVSQYTPKAAWKFSYNINAELFNTSSSDGGTTDLEENSARVQSGVNAAGYADIKTKKVLNYQPGISALIRFTGTFTTGVANSEQFIGYGDENDGFFFGFKNTEFGVMKRKGGVDDFIPAVDFNEEGLYTGFDCTKLNVYQIDFQWLGAGEIRFYVEYPETGGFVLVHRIKQVGSSMFTSIDNPSLPLYMYVKNTGNTTNLSVRSPSATAGLEGLSTNTLHITRGISASKINVGVTEIPIFSIDNPPLYFTKANRLIIQPGTLSIAAEGNAASNVTIRVYKNTTLTGAVYNDVDINSTSLRLDTSATAFADGDLITGIVINGSSNDMLDLTSTGIELYPDESITITGQATGNVDVDLFLDTQTEL